MFLNPSLLCSVEFLSFGNEGSISKESEFVLCFTRSRILEYVRKESITTLRLIQRVSLFVKSSSLIVIDGVFTNFLGSVKVSGEVCNSMVCRKTGLLVFECVSLSRILDCVRKESQQ